MLRMLRGFIGDENFKYSLRVYKYFRLKFLNIVKENTKN